MPETLGARSDNLYQLHSLAGSSALYFIAQHFDSGILVLPSSTSVYETQRALSFYLQTHSKTSAVFSFPAFERLFEGIVQEPETLVERLRTQVALVEKNSSSLFLITHLEALTQLTLSPKFLKTHLIEVRRKEFYDYEKFTSDLKAVGYRRDELAEDAGTFSVRGHLIDVFSPYEDQPYRIEFFGDEIISIRRFEPQTQRSLLELESIVIAPVRELILKEDLWNRGRMRLKDFADSRAFPHDDREQLLEDLIEHRGLAEPRWVLPAFVENLSPITDYLPKNLPLIHIDPEKSRSLYEVSLVDEDRSFHELRQLCYPPSTLRKKPEDVLPPDAHLLRTAPYPQGLVYHVRAFENLRHQLLKSQSLQGLSRIVRDCQDEGCEFHFVFESEKRMQSVRQNLEGLVENVFWHHGSEFSGFSSTTFGKAFLNEKDIFGAKRKYRLSRTSRSAKDFLRHFSDLKTGDTIIHEDHGIGKFLSLQVLDIQGVKGEFLLLEYADNDRLYLPIYRLEKVSRFSSEGSGQPRLDKLGSQSFVKKRAKLKEDILRIAHELLQVAAQRKLIDRQRPAPSAGSQFEEFCARFPHELTPDQEKAVDEVKGDLQKAYPMDRLICGDVGFGKTEIALRASMMTLLRGQQVALIAPTTILVEQHRRSFEKRFSGFPFRIAHLSRFLSQADQRTALKDVADGRIQLVIGTHRLLQSDVSFQNLGLLIVDEEQRFGVKHKERIKRMKPQLDVLTLSATPIPRTLQMSIVGIRDLSLITTPPESREAVRTYVGTFDDALVRNACLREVNRGGQVLIVHNRVETILHLQKRLEVLMPELKIVVGHGQMKEEELEQNMLQFIEGKAPILLSTSIIENGLDIPNANTLIVDHAEIFGLSNLYQLRGRVGRSHRVAHAYFLVHETTALTPDASRRLQVLQSYTELGSGFAVATHDLEIRGSGNLLGIEQSGVIEEVGLELYTQMLEDTLASLRNEAPRESLAELSSGYAAFIPEVYIPDATVRIATYKKLDEAQSVQELIDLEEELLDRFGLFPREVHHLIEILGLRALALPLSLESFECFPGRLSLKFKTTTRVSPQKLLPLLNKTTVIDPKGRLTYTFTSALKRTKPNDQTAADDHPELKDFAECRNFLKRLLTATE